MLSFFQKLHKVNKKSKEHYPFAKKYQWKENELPLETV